jgi:putative ABC transport system substrate-binding protein
MIGRRRVMGVLGGTAASAVLGPCAVRAQQRAMPVVGYLTSLGRNERPNLTDAFRRGLSETGLVEGRNVAIEYRHAENQYDRLPALAADLVARKVALIAATGGGAAVLAAKASTTTVPIVFTSGGDPVRAGFVASLNRPGGNLTGVTWFGALVAGKALGLLHELVPRAAIFALMVNPNNPESEYSPPDAQATARTLGRELIVLNAGNPSEIGAAFATMRQRRVDALVVGSDPFFTGRRQQIVALAERDSIPAMYINREFVTEGGLASYGNDPLDAYRRAGVYAGRILNGASPSDLPVDQATKFEFLINLKTARTLGLDVPAGLSARADEVIE